MLHPPHGASLTGRATPAATPTGRCSSCSETHGGQHVSSPSEDKDGLGTDRQATRGKGSLWPEEKAAVTSDPAHQPFRRLAPGGEQPPRGEQPLGAPSENGQDARPGPGRGSQRSPDATPPHSGTDTRTQQQEHFSGDRESEESPGQVSAVVFALGPRPAHGRPWEAGAAPVRPGPRPGVLQDPSESHSPAGAPPHAACSRGTA